jgi:tetratricopeptide (TPR) repeat protein
MPRLDQLHALLLKTPTDPFLTYGIALEHKKLGDTSAAIEWLEKTISLDARYCYAYFQKGQILESISQPDPARQSYRAGITAARAAGDGHAESELRGALEMME